MTRSIAWRQFDRNSRADLKLIERICRESGSRAVAAHAAYLRTAIWQTAAHPENLWCEIADDVAFYMCRRCRAHVRGVDTAVLSEYHGTGYGRALHERRLARMRAAGIGLFTFRTSRDNSALGFWLHMGARIMDVVGGDYEMEIRLNG